MRTPRAILIVEADLPSLFGLLDVLRDAGYECTGAATYEAGRQLLSVESFDLAIVNARLGPLNGLHLIRQCRLRSPGMETIALTSVYDQEARDEVRRYGAASIDLPVAPRRLLALVAKSLSLLVHRRRWVRKPVRLDAGVTVDERPAALVDVCYGGVQFETSGLEGDLPDVVRLAVPALGQPLLVAPVWSHRAEETQRLRCGATVLSRGGPVVRAWRDMVDTLPAARPDSPA